MVTSNNERHIDERHIAKRHITFYSLCDTVCRLKQQRQQRQEQPQQQHQQHAGSDVPLATLPSKNHCISLSFTMTMFLRLSHRFPSCSFPVLGGYRNGILSQPFFPTRKSNGCLLPTTTTTTFRGLSTRKKDDGGMHFIRAGLPLILFCGLGAWVVSNGIEGKNRERDAFQGRISRSERQAMMDKEHDEMMDKLNHIMKEDFDNTKRIERPEEVLARRRKERERRNVWYRRWWRTMTGQQQQQP